jgi:DNA-binding CsgD family transcriptional regulator
MADQPPRPVPIRPSVPLWALICIQVACAAFFLADIVTDLLGHEVAIGPVGHLGFELIAVIALGFGIVLSGLEIRKVTLRSDRAEEQLKAASGAFTEVLEEHFDRWSLTPSERDVALLAIKGLSIAEIAQVRETKEGTIKAQCNAVYRKAGVSGRPQLLSVFIEELL